MKFLKKLFIPFCLACCMALGIAACGKSEGTPDSSSSIESSSDPITYTLHLTADKTTALRGDVVKLAAYRRSSEGDETLLNNAVFSIVEGGTFATISGDKVTVLQNAESGNVIKVKAKVGATDSNIVEIKVSVPLESVQISANGVSNVKNGSSVVLSKTVMPEGADVSKLTWVVTADDESYYSMNGDVLIVSESAPTGAVIKVKAVSGEITSGELSFTVGYPLETLEITPPTETNILNNAAVVLNVTKVPSNTTNGEYKWVVTADDESYYSINGDVLIVSATAPTGAIIKVKAVASADESIASGEVAFTVGYPLQSLTINASGSTNIPNGKFVDLTVRKFPENTTNGDYKWEFVEGKEYCTFDEQTGRLTVNEDAPLRAKIILKVVGTVATSVEDTIEFLVGIPLEEIHISSTAPYILTHGESYDISLTPTPEEANTTAVRWVVSQPSWASVANGKLVISETAPHGKTFTVQAVSGTITSEVLTFQIGVGLTALTATVDGAVAGETVSLNPGAYKNLSIARIPENTTDTVYKWEIAEENKGYAKIENDTLFIDVDAPIGEMVRFYAVSGDVQSKTIEVIIGTPIQKITVSADKTEIVKGEFATLSAEIEPANANFPYEWVVIADDETYYSLEGNVLTVSLTAVTGSTITVKAVSGNVESDNTWTFTVLPTEEELNQEKYFIIVADEITLDKNGASNPVLEVGVIDGNYNDVTDKEIEFTVVSGGEYLDITPNGMYCNLSPKGHGKAEIQVSLLNTQVVETVYVDVIVPPSSLSLPEVFTQRSDIQYAFSMYSHNVAGEINGKEALPFVATVDVFSNNANPCKEIKYLFSHENGAVGDEVATYADGKIIFHQTGLITVTASSDSGSEVETTASYTFNINDGFNVYNFESAAALFDQKYYIDQPVNFVALEKPVGEYDDPTDPTYGYTYGYDFVPSVALKKHKDQTFLSLINSDKTRIIAVNKGAYINGNNHVIDASQMRILKDSEISAGNKQYGKEYAHHGGLISVEPWTSEGAEVNDVTGQFSVKIYNLDVKGPSTIDYENTENPGVFSGSYLAGINVGHHAYSARYSVDIDNVTATGFKHGMNMLGVYEGTLKNAYAYNCYQNGFLFRASTMTIENLKLGPCGAVGIELAPEASNQAGIEKNQAQTITFKGTIDAMGNYITLNTNYLNEYAPLGPGSSVDQLVNASLQFNGLTANQEAHMRELVPIEGTDNVVSKICMITFILMGTVQNESQALYADAAGGIIDATELPKEGFDETHQFISLTVYAAQNMPIGRVLVYNLKYNPNANA